jgi:hypothetical protein
LAKAYVCPFALNKMSYGQKSAMVIYRSKTHATPKTQLPAHPGTEM